MDYITLLAAAVAAAKRVERVVEIRPVENGLVYINQKGEERFVEVAKPIIQPKEIYDDSELKREVATAIVEAISPILQEINNSQLSLEALQSSLSNFREGVGEDMVGRTNALLALLRSLKTDVDGKSDLTHVHEQYLTESQVVDLISSNPDILEQFQMVEGEISAFKFGLDVLEQNIRQNLGRINRELDSKSEVGHSHPEYVVWSELERRLSESGYDDGAIRQRLATVQDDLVRMSREQKDSVDTIVSRLLADIDRRLETKSQLNHTHDEFSEIDDRVARLDMAKSDKGHLHTEYLTKEDVQKILPDIPPGLESAKIERNHLILYLTDGSSIDVGKVVKSPTVVGGGRGQDGKSAYQIWLDLGNVGTEQDFLDSLGSGSGSNTWVYIGEPTSYTNNPSIVFQEVTIDGEQVFQMGVYEP